MKLSKREQQIAIGLGVTMILLVLYEVVISPYTDELRRITDSIKAANVQKDDDNSVLHRQDRLQKDWTEIKAGGLTADESRAESQALTAVSDWASRAGVSVTQQKTERATDALPFQIIRFSVTGSGNTPGIAGLLYSLETATIPVRVDDITVTPKKEGTDDLQISISLSTLCLKPDAETVVKLAAIQAEEQPWN